MEKVLIKKKPKEDDNGVHASKSTSKDVVDAKELYEREKQKQNVVLLD